VQDAEVQTRVLVVADAPERYADAANALRQADLQVTTAAGRGRGLDAGRGARPHVVVAVAAWPGADAVGLCGELRALPRLKSAPLLVVGMPGDGGRVLASGADDFVAAPCPAPLLAARVVRLAEGRRAVEAQAEALAREQAARDFAASAEERFRLVMDGMPQMVWTAEADGSHDYFNQRTFDYAGMSLEEMKGRGWARAIHPDDIETCRRRWAHAVETGTSYEIEYRIRRACDGAYRWHLGRAVPLRDADGRIMRWFGTCTDIDDQKRAEAAMRDARQDLERRVAERTAELSRANADLEAQIDERERIEKALRYESNLLAALMDYLPDAIYFKDTRSRFTRVSRHTHLHGMTSPDQAIGKTDFDFFGPEHAREAFEDEQHIVRTGLPVIDKLEKETFPDGSESWVLTTKVPIFDGEGRVTGIVGASRDVTELKRMEAELRQARDAALESARLKSEFLANMSHEIRTPMNGVIGMTGLLLDTELSEEQREYADTIRSSGEALLTIINDILDFSKVEAGMLAFEALDFDLRAAVESTVDLFAEQAQRKGLEIASVVHADVPPALRGDPSRLRQVLTNLVGNAVKFTERGEVVVRVTKEADAASGVVVRFAVTDTGIGLQEEARSRLFQPFAQADGSTTRKYGGTGLGLAISKQLVELMGGEIGYESVPGRGSTFWFTATLDVQAAAHEAGPAGLEGLRVLIADDNEAHCTILAQQLTPAGVVTTAVGSGSQALEVLREAVAWDAPFDVVLLDWRLPDMDGAAVARAVADDVSLAATRVVLMPPFGRRDNARGTGEMGVAAYLPKPIRQAPLFECLASVRRDNGAGPRRTFVTGPLITSRPSGVARASSRARVLIAEDNIVNQKVTMRLVEKFGYRADAVANGLEALEALERIPYALVLMDCQMPEMDGFTATREIRAREDGAARGVRIVALTANAMEGDRERCLAAGMDDYLAKPVKSAELRATLDRWLGGGEPAAGAGAECRPA
jgi:PAS domain S-box-containing protein